MPFPYRIVSCGSGSSASWALCRFVRAVRAMSQSPEAPLAVAAAQEVVVGRGGRWWLVVWWYVVVWWW